MQEAEDVNDKKEYEVAFVAAAEDGAAAVEKELVAHGCAVSGKGTLAAIKLAYPIKKHTSGFFGYYWFVAPADAVKKLHDVLAVAPSILRFLIVTPPVKVTVRESHQPRERSAQAKTMTSAVSAEKTAEQTLRVSAPTSARAPEALSNELLEKKLEEILK